MAATDPSLVSLLPHPSTTNGAVRRIAASAALVGPDLVRFQYVLEADLEQVRIPAPVVGAARADGLWANTCFEAFVGRGRSPPYMELNFSPSGQWAAYGFQSYREGMAPAFLAAAPRLTLRRDEQRLELQAEVRLRGAQQPAPSGAAAAGPLRIALTAVVEDQEGRLSYWALRHRSGRPDFHHPDSFALALELPATP